MIGNRDGKLGDRIVAGLISGSVTVAIAMGGQYLGFWSDSKAADRETAAAITALTKRMDAVEIEAKDARRSAAEDRQKITEIASDVRNSLRSQTRIESLLDRLLMMPPASRP
jgi:hypothetical protein